MSSFRVMSTDSESYETTSSYYGRVDNGGYDANDRRIAQIEKAFGSAGQRLRSPGRFLVGEGVLTKACRKRLKPRQFFLFNDILVYGSVMVGSRRRFNKQRVIPLEEVKMQSLEDEGHFRNGWMICTLEKSFAVYASTPSEKAQWVGHMEKCVEELLHSGMKTPPPLDARAAAWVPDDEAESCMNCNEVQFSVAQRKHHCRKCGAVVCSSCSANKMPVSIKSDKASRVCNSCYDGQNGARRPESPPKSDGNVDEEMVAESIAEKKEAPPRPPPPKLFPDGDKPYEGNPPPTGGGEDESISEVNIPKRNPKMYQLVAMESESSFWWDSVDSTVNLNDDGADQKFAEADDAEKRSSPSPSSTSSTSSHNDKGDTIEKRRNSVTSSFA